MQSLAKAFGRSAQTGAPLPEVYKQFTASKIIFRKSATSMIAGASGAFKSVLAINLLIAWARQGVRGLYFSADADEFTTAKRAAAILTGTPVEAVERDLRHEYKGKQYREALADLDATRWIYRASDVEEIERHLGGFEAVYGCYPDVVFVDNLLNMTGESEGNEWAAARYFVRDLDILAREAECHICVLHHCKESEWRKGLPPPRSAIMGQIAQFPRLILTVAPSAENMNLLVAVVKNTNGPQDLSGDTFTALNLDAEKITLTDGGLFSQSSWQ